MNDRIRLAEAMGLDENPKGFEMQTLIEGEMQDYPYPGFEPFTDANDDYAVLQWMRANLFPEHGIDRSLTIELCSYSVGDFARAALKTLCTGDGSE